MKRFGSGISRPQKGLGSSNESFKLNFRLAPSLVFVSVLLKILLWVTDVCASWLSNVGLYVSAKHLRDLLFIVRVNLPKQTTCDADYLEIKDGDSLESPLIARYCGDVPYTELSSSGTRVLLHFVSDGVNDVAQRGFQLQHIGESKKVIPNN